MPQAKGSFEVKATPLETDALAQEVGCMRMKFEKQFTGPLQASGLVSMMGMMNQQIGSGAYVALEKITGTLDSKKGSFGLQHNSSMDKGQPKQSITVIPDSGTGELAGLSGEMIIDIVDGKHFYTFNYSIQK